MFPTTADQQLLRGIATSLTTALTDADGEPVAGLTVTVTVTRADGTALYTDEATTDNDDGTYSLDLLATDLATLDILTATWTETTVTRAITTHEVIAAYYFAASELTTTELGRASALDRAAFAQLRHEVETEAEVICRTAFVPRYRRIVLDGNGRGRLLLPDPRPRTIRSLRTYTSPTTYTSLTQGELDALILNEAGWVERADGGIFSWGCRNLVIEYEHGYERPPADLKRAALRRARTRSNSALSGVPDRATSYTAENGATYRLAMPGAQTTGDPEVDAVYARYSRQFSQFLVA